MPSRNIEDISLLKITKEGERNILLERAQEPRNFPPVKLINILRTSLNECQ